MVAKEQIIREVWRDTFIDDTSVTRNISVLRRILGPGVIETILKRGYLFVPRTEESTETRPRGDSGYVEAADATEQFNLKGEPRNSSIVFHSVERPSLKGVAISALVLLVEAAFTRNHH
jgi:DNA-binding winged helix-turn-helix (wHTH) protein